MRNKQVDVLGTPYTLIMSDDSKHPALTECDAYCDETTKECVIDAGDKDSITSKGNLAEYRKKNCRHELTHAFLFESGLAENSDWALNEEIVDWIARQFPKMLKAFKDADCL